MLALGFELGVGISDMDHPVREWVLSRRVLDIRPQILLDVCSDL